MSVDLMIMLEKKILELSLAAERARKAGDENRSQALIKAVECYTEAQKELRFRFNPQTSEDFIS